MWRPANDINAGGSSPTAGRTTAVKLNTSYNELMVAWIDNASHVMWDVEKQGFAPKNDADWVELEDHAIQLAAAGTLIQLPGLGPTDTMWASQDGWKVNAQLLSDAGKTALARQGPQSSRADRSQQQAGTNVRGLPQAVQAGAPERGDRPPETAL